MNDSYMKRPLLFLTHNSVIFDGFSVSCAYSISAL